MSATSFLAAGTAALGIAMTLAAGSALAATQPPATGPEAKPSIVADYTIYIGGFMAAEGSINATLEEGNYLVRSNLGVSGMPARFYNAQWNMTSEGSLSDEKLKPARFAFRSDEKGKIKEREITYDAAGVPTPVFDPPEKDLIDILPFERRNANHAESEDGREDAKEHHDVILFGLGRYGGAIAQRLLNRGVSTLGVDFNPSAVRLWRERGLDAVYGDLTDQEFLTHLPLDRVKWVISTTSDHDTGVTHEDTRIPMISTLRKFGYEGKIAVTSQRGAALERLKEAGADLILFPFQDAADQAVELITSEAPEPERIETPEDCDDQKELDEIKGL